jgi:hypothetical protein
MQNFPKQNRYFPSTSSTIKYKNYSYNLDPNVFKIKSIFSKYGLLDIEK